MQNLKNMDVFEVLITQKLLKSPKDPFVRSALIFMVDLSFYAIPLLIHDVMFHIAIPHLRVLSYNHF